jgi:hypothetical protein
VNERLNKGEKKGWIPIFMGMTKRRGWRIPLTLALALSLRGERGKDNN